MASVGTAIWVVLPDWVKVPCTEAGADATVSGGENELPGVVSVPIANVAPDPSDGPFGENVVPGWKDWLVQLMQPAAALHGELWAPLTRSVAATVTDQSNPSPSVFV